jgi:hypothetical protein
MTEGMKVLLPKAMVEWGEDHPQDYWHGWLEGMLPEMSLEDFDDIWARYEELKARRMAA